MILNVRDFGMSGYRHPTPIALLLFAACSPSVEKADTAETFRARETTLYAQTDSMGAAPVRHSVIAVKTRQALVENSGAAMSTEQPGVLFTINDSGNEPILFALDTTGADRGAWRVEGATNVDWEAISAGPCTNAPPVPDASAYVARCLYIGDVGDNDATHSSLKVYQLREPRAQSADFTGAIPARALTFTYDNGKHDVEAMFVTSDGSINLVTKRPLRTATLRLRPALVFRIGSKAWSRSESAVARLVDSLPIIPGSALQRTITDASISTDGRWLAARTYRQLYIMRVDSATHAISQQKPRVCNIFDLNELQGEGMTWLVSSNRLLLTSEGRDEPLQIIECPER